MTDDTTFPQGRVKPRLEFCRLRRKVPTLTGVTAATDATFCKQLGEDPSTYRDFMGVWQAQRQSSSLSIDWMPSGLDFRQMIIDST
mmetsp:Transcript_50215/g.112829  ORF Transcript_50215/g.112829 Transcript_50215/m.112829 type:complete len:86 (+) Transcript_50215:666-923(+)|eukprot:CAMPEP_0181198548 /NCGR_PEP_ID=MMETSP1096-20121128/16683_1 /TAXON_ID=156174 ORGANISM="Chrysochromulina ericina, Strain CCMP281" /NCGR_SAMPLE_ID=MMETSP1096 /ASSEMBLY_ACC=CAM_ASM_000453 /LENGTH=85 /DNA_ID=CAMNT_0023288633 /DNA_START=155 /DNA_END=412 /DNA_ORIENTATION=-